MNVRLPDDVVRRAKAAAALRGESMQVWLAKVIEGATAKMAQMDA